MPQPDLTNIGICVFDAYGTLFDFNSAVARHRAAIGPKADALSDMWRSKQIQYTWLRNSMGAYAPFWQVTGEALDHCLAAHAITDASVREKLMSAYLALDPFPEVPGVLDRLANAGKRLAILSNGNPEMLDPMVKASGLANRFEAVLSVDAAKVVPEALFGDDLAASADEITRVFPVILDCLAAATGLPRKHVYTRALALTRRQAED